MVAQDYPTRPITLVVPYPPGGGVDSMARIVADKLSAALGKQVVVDNRGGGSGLVGTRAVARAAPDGYTLMLAHTGTIAINPSLFANPGFDPRKDFTAIGCDDVKAEMTRLGKCGIRCGPISDEGWGLLTTIRLPGGGDLGLYEPRHPSAHGRAR